MENSKLKTAKSILKDEIKENAHTRDNLYGNAASSRKLEVYIIESVLSGISKGECLDWLFNILKDYEVPNEFCVKTRSSAELQFSILDRFVNDTNFKNS